jgi:V/A-type H+-transporting ATPase subunit I
MALNVGFNNIVSGIMASLILVVGHLFNIVLCGFGILVHGLRLNVLEFSGHLGLEWTGLQYKPFRRNK